MIEDLRFRRAAVPVLRWAFVLLLLAPLGLALYRQGEAVRNTLGQIDWKLAALGLLIGMVAQPLMGLISWLVLLHLGYRKPYPQILWLYFLSQAAKYLPGGFWAFPGRVIAYQSVGVDRLASIVSLVREVAALYLGAALLGLFGLAQGLLTSSKVSTMIGLGVVVCILGVFFTQVPYFWHLLGQIPWLHRSSRVFQSLEEAPFSLWWMLSAIPASLGFWLLTGTGFWFLANAIQPQAAVPWLQAASMFAIAWCAGFVVVIAPAGLGVRESTLVLLLARLLPSGAALGVAVFARFWWTLAETPFILAGLAWTSRQPGLNNRIENQS
jgi:uncharacterized membrane protein YbhN (UPF0104 family)